MFLSISNVEQWEFRHWDQLVVFYKSQKKHFFFNSNLFMNYETVLENFLNNFFWGTSLRDKRNLSFKKVSTAIYWKTAAKFNVKKSLFYFQKWKRNKDSNRVNCTFAGETIIFVSFRCIFNSLSHLISCLMSHIISIAVYMEIYV